MSDHISDKDNFIIVRNIKAIHYVLPDVYNVIIDWEMGNKTSYTDFDEFMDKNKIVDKRILAKSEEKWLKNNDNHLKDMKFDNFDVTFLHQLVHIICRKNLSAMGTKEWEDKVKVPGSLESCLKSLKEFRNNLSHDKEIISQPELFWKMKTKIIETLTCAAQLLDKNTELDEVVHEVTEKLKKIENSSTFSHEERVEIIEKTFINRMRRRK